MVEDKFKIKRVYNEHYSYSRKNGGYQKYTLPIGGRHFRKYVEINEYNKAIVAGKEEIQYSYYKEHKYSIFLIIFGLFSLFISSAFFVMDFISKDTPDIGVVVPTGIVSLILFCSIIVHLVNTPRRVSLVADSKFRVVIEFKNRKIKKQFVKKLAYLLSEKNRKYIEEKSKNESDKILMQSASVVNSDITQQQASNQSFITRRHDVKNEMAKERQILELLKSNPNATVKNELKILDREPLYKIISLFGITAIFLTLGIWLFSYFFNTGQTIDLYLGGGFSSILIGVGLFSFIFFIKYIIKGLRFYNAKKKNDLVSVYVIDCNANVSSITRDSRTQTTIKVKLKYAFLDSKEQLRESIYKEVVRTSSSSSSAFPKIQTGDILKGYFLNDKVYLDI